MAALLEKMDQQHDLYHGGSAEAMVEALAKDQFVDALPDEDMHATPDSSEQACHTEGCSLDSSRARILPTGKQTEGQVCVGGSAGGETPCAARTTDQTKG